MSDEKLGRIHEASLTVLEDVGVRITTEPARRLLADAGCTVTDGGIVRIPRRIVADAIASAPNRIVLYDGEGEEALVVEGENSYFGFGGTGQQIDIQRGNEYATAIATRGVGVTGLTNRRVRQSS